MSPKQAIVSLYNILLACMAARHGGAAWGDRVHEPVAEALKCAVHAEYPDVADILVDRLYTLYSVFGDEVDEAALEAEAERIRERQRT